MTEIAGRAPVEPPLPRATGRRAVVGGVIFAAVLLVFLTQTRLPAVLEKLPTLDRGVSGAGRSTFSAVLDPLAFPEELRWIAYGVNLWDANAVGMFFAILLGGAATTAIAPGARASALLARGGRAGAGIGGGLGLPLFMCSACSAPVSMGFYRAGATLEATLGIILGSALFNPVGLFAIFLLLPAEMGVARIVFGLLMLFAVVPAIARTRRSPAPELRHAASPPPAVRDEPPAWSAAVRDGLLAWWRASAEHALRLAPPMAAAGFLVGVVLVLAPPQGLSDAVGSSVPAIVAAAAVGTLLQLPTLFEIPLVIGVLALGLDAGAATALLLAGPSAGVVTLAITRRDVGWKVPALLLAATFGGSLAGGVAVGAL